MKMFKKGAADLIAIVVSVVVVGGLAIGIMTYLGNNTKKSADDGVSQVTSSMNALLDTYDNPGQAAAE